METVLKYERVVLIKELDERIKEVGEVFEIASVVPDNKYFVLRNAGNKVAVGVVSFEDFEKYFVREEDFKGWTKWTPFVGVDGQNDCVYRTNHKKVQVRFLKDNVRAEACCNNKEDEFNLFFGLQVAYTRCYNKVLSKRKEELEKELNKVHIELTDNKEMIKRMIEALK